MSRRSEKPMGTSDLTVKAGTQVPARDTHDFYPTPWGVITRALAHFSNIGVLDESSLIADIGAGSGRWGQVARSFFPNAAIYGFEQQPVPKPDGYDAWVVGDVMEQLPLYVGYRFNLIMGNPPFYLFEQGTVGTLFRTCWSAMRDGGKLMFFADQRFTSSAARYAGVFSWWPPKYIRKYVQRVSFFPEGHPRCGKSNAREHCLYVWEKGWDGSTQFSWEPRNMNDNKFPSVFLGTNTWQDMLALGLVSEGKDVQEG
jgi:hypothetical protein